jgi:hypothetical protein
MRAKGKASGDSPKTLRNNYLREQARVWLALKPNVSSRNRRAHLRRYLVDCAIPLFVDLTEPKIESKIHAVVDRLLSSKRTRK